MSSLLLADYGSDSSDDEPQLIKPVAKPEVAKPKNTRKVITITATAGLSDDEDDAPNVKRRKTGSGSQLFDLLPPPKNSNPSVIPDALKQPVTLKPRKVIPVQEEEEELAIAPYPGADFDAFTSAPALEDLPDEAIKTLGRLDPRAEIQTVRASDQVATNSAIKAQRLEDQARKAVDGENGSYLFTDHQHRKHNIQWLAHMARSREAELNRKFLEEKQKKVNGRSQYGF
jgi:hypothetical protein